PIDKTGLEAARKHLSEAKAHLEKAEAAYEEDKFGEAFDLARSAEVLARNGSRLLEPKVEVKKCGVNTFQVFEECRDGAGFKAVYVQCYDGFEDKRHADVCQSSEEWQKHARVLCADRCSTEPRPIPLPKPVEIKPIPAPISPKPIDETIVCTEQYEPVCGVNAKTYPNACYARRAGVEIKHRGKCEEEILRSEILKPILPVESTPESTSSIAPTPTTAPLSKNVSAVDSETFIIIQNGIFSPDIVKIKKGGKVTWVNKSERAVWPASNPHPIHTGYPGFDAFRGLKTGETYSFVFERIGSWKYHDHLNPFIGGIIEVVE
ncbi:MAG: Kazal-type serine protease inhibitor domain-containing protein, partial [Candidatus Paceibacteria bacterium]